MGRNICEKQTWFRFYRAFAVRTWSGWRPASSLFRIPGRRGKTEAAGGTCRRNDPHWPPARPTLGTSSGLTACTSPPSAPGACTRESRRVLLLLRCTVLRTGSGLQVGGHGGTRGEDERTRCRDSAARGGGRDRPSPDLWQWDLNGHSLRHSGGSAKWARPRNQKAPSNRAPRICPVFPPATARIRARSHPRDEAIHSAAARWLSLDEGRRGTGWRPKTICAHPNSIAPTPFLDPRLARVRRSRLPRPRERSSPAPRGRPYRWCSGHGPL